MFGPKHSVEAITRELIDGLDDGSVVLRYGDAQGIDVPALEKQLWDTIQAQARRSRVLVAVSCTAGLLAFLGGVASLLLAEKQALQAYHVGVGVLVSLIAGFLFGFAFSTYRLMRTREKIAMLRAWADLLKNIDPESAARVASQVAPRLPREKELSH